MASPAQTSNDPGFLRPLGLVLLVGLLVRLAAFAIPIDPLQNPDAVAFRALAQSVATTGRLAYVDQGAPGMVLHAFRSLLYPIFLAAFAGTADRLPPWAPVLLVQSLLGIATIACVADIGRIAFGRRVGITTAWIGALYLSSIACEREILSEALFTPLLACATWILVRFPDRARFTIAAGAVFALAGWVRPAGFVAGAGALCGRFAGGLFAGERPHIDAGRLVRSVAGVALGMAIVAAPGLWRNARVLGAPVVLTSGGMNFWIGNDRGSVGDAWVVMAREGPRLGEVGMDRWFYADTYAHAGDIVGTLPRALVHKTFEFFAPATREPWLLPYRLLWPLAFAGLVVGLLRPQAIRFAHAWSILLGVVLSQVALAFATVPWGRYRFPIEVLFWPLGALALARLGGSPGAGRWVIAGIVLVNLTALAFQILR